MAKREYPKEETAKADVLIPAPGKGGLSGRALSLIKFILGLCLLPFVYSVSLALAKELNLISPKLQVYFWSGVAGFLVFYLFVWEPTPVYLKGQKLVGVMFQFFHPLLKFAPYLIPAYTIALFILYALSAAIFGPDGLINYFVFLLGSSITLHLIFSAKSIRSKQGDFLKANYIFGFSFIYLVNITLLALGFSFIFKEILAVNFFSASFNEAGVIFSTVFKQLF